MYTWVDAHLSGCVQEGRGERVCVCACVCAFGYMCICGTGMWEMPGCAAGLPLGLCASRGAGSRYVILLWIPTPVWPTLLCHLLAGSLENSVSPLTLVTLCVTQGYGEESLKIPSREAAAPWQGNARERGPPAEVCAFFSGFDSGLADGPKSARLSPTG